MEEKDYDSEQDIQIDEMGEGGADTGESIADNTAEQAKDAPEAIT